VEVVDAAVNLLELEKEPFKAWWGDDLDEFRAIARSKPLQVPVKDPPLVLICATCG
jgi:hypothetical protein